jgi:hypothetical protein
MARRCVLCRQNPAQFSRRKYCAECYERFILGNGRVDVPEDHPWAIERRARVERMRRRAEQGLPIFEEVDPDLY